MKSTYLVILLLIILANTSPAQSELELTIEVTNIKEIIGTIRACLIADEDDFLSHCYKSKNVVVTNSKILLKFDNLDAGTYCISIFHDKDDNEKLNRGGLFGMPNEPYAFSNNAKRVFGPPKYNKCTFKLVKDKKMVISL